MISYHAENERRPTDVMRHTYRICLTDMTRWGMPKRCAASYIFYEEDGTSPTGRRFHPSARKLPFNCRLNLGRKQIWLRSVLALAEGYDVASTFPDLTACLSHSISHFICFCLDNCLCLRGCQIFCLFSNLSLCLSGNLSVCVSVCPSA